MQERQFTPEEAQKVIELSMRLQVQWSEHVSLREIEQSAAEFGVDPQFVHLAVQQLDGPPVETKRVPKQKIGGPSLALGIYTAIFSVVVCAFCVHVISTYSFKLEDCTLPAVMSIIFGLAAGVQRRPVLALIPILATFAMSIVALFLIGSTHNRVGQPAHIFNALLGTVIWQMVASGAGYGLAKLAEHLQQGARRSMTN